MLLLALILQASVVVASETHLPSLPDAPEPTHLPQRMLRDFMNGVAFSFSTRQISARGERTYGGQMLFDVNSRVTVGAGYEGVSWSASAIVRPVPRKR